jgi:uncharacterized protein YdiU (UPF0061 family)
LISSFEAIPELSGEQISSAQTPVATVYSGHQFGVWAGQLGDGRAMLLGEMTDSEGQRQEIQLKGAGETPYSRRADGRAVLRSSVREYLCSEAMHGLGIPTTRALHLSGSKQYAMREQPETTAIVTRVAPSFIRFGHFEHFYYQGRIDELKQLADFVLQHYYPQCLSAENPYAELLGDVAIRTARLVAQWQASGFMHGVLNTDNMSVLGLTLDYGPFGLWKRSTTITSAITVIIRGATHTATSQPSDSGMSSHSGNAGAADQQRGNDRTSAGQLQIRV